MTTQIVWLDSAKLVEDVDGLPHSVVAPERFPLVDRADDGSPIFGGWAREEDRP